MAQTLTSLLTHIVFSTKHRADLITPAIEPELYAYLGGIAANQQAVLLAAGGTANHLHLLVSQSKNIALKDLLQDLKGDSSKWIKTKGAEFSDFHWQDGYAAFSLGQSQVAKTRAYLAKQKVHHKKTPFEDELKIILDKYDVEYDERYLWT